jgi:hypothetical protein
MLPTITISSTPTSVLHLGHILLHSAARGARGEVAFRLLGIRNKPPIRFFVTDALPSEKLLPLRTGLGLPGALEAAGLELSGEEVTAWATSCKTDCRFPSF